MAYSENNYVNQRRRDYHENAPTLQKINKPLNEYYNDKASLFLEGGTAHRYAKDFKGVTSHQLRKILGQSKQCVQEFEKKDYSFQKSANLLFALLPLAAYNAGRDRKLKTLYNFLVVHINKNSITKKEDIEVFDQLLTSIIAYHKFEEGER